MAKKNRQEQEFLSDVIVNLDRLPALGRHLKIRADNEQLENITNAANVSSVGRFSADIHVVRVKGGVQVSGELHAEVTQPCVVSLEPVNQQINVELNRVYMPNPGQVRASAEKENAPGSEKYIDLADEELPDYFEGSELDLNDFLLESFSMAIDLYPRAPGAKMSKEQAGDDPAKLSPFAVLKDLN